MPDEKRPTCSVQGRMKPHAQKQGETRLYPTIQYTHPGTRTCLRRRYAKEPYEQR